MSGVGDRFEPVLLRRQEPRAARTVACALGSCLRRNTGPFSIDAVGKQGRITPGVTEGTIVA